MDTDVYNYILDLEDGNLNETKDLLESMLEMVNRDIENAKQ